MFCVSRVASCLVLVCVVSAVLCYGAVCGLCVSMAPSVGCAFGADCVCCGHVCVCVSVCPS